MSIRLTQLIWNTEINLIPSEHHVLLCLAYFANDLNNLLCCPSINTIAKKCHLSRDQVKRILKNLVNSKIIKKTNRITENNITKSNIYEINESLLGGGAPCTPPGAPCTPPRCTMHPNKIINNSIDKKENNIKEKPPSAPEQHLSSVLRSTAKLVIDFLRLKTGRNYQYVDTTLKPIIERLKEGITLEQCKAVIVKKHREWGNNKEMEKYLRPSTLFRESNFYDKYLPECVTEEDKKNIMKKD